MFSSAFQMLSSCRSSVIPHGLAQLLQPGFKLSFSCCTAAIISLIDASLKLTFVSVANKERITRSLVFCSTFPAPFKERASPINAPVSSSCRFATSAVLPQTPTFPLQPSQPAVCSHWKQNIFCISFPIGQSLLFYEFLMYLVFFRIAFLCIYHKNAAIRTLHKKN